MVFSLCTPFVPLPHPLSYSVMASYSHLYALRRSDTLSHHPSFPLPSTTLPPSKKTTVASIQSRPCRRPYPDLRHMSASHGPARRPCVLVKAITYSPRPSQRGTPCGCLRTTRNHLTHPEPRAPPYPGRHQSLSLYTHPTHSFSLGAQPVLPHRDRPLRSAKKSPRTLGILNHSSAPPCTIALQHANLAYAGPKPNTSAEPGHNTSGSDLPPPILLSPLTTTLLALLTGLSPRLGSPPSIRPLNRTITQPPPAIALPNRLHRSIAFTTVLLSSLTSSVLPSPPGDSPQGHLSGGTRK